MARRRRKKFWIAGAIKKRGALTKAAKRAGKSIAAYCAPILKKGKATTAWHRCHLWRILKAGRRKWTWRRRGRRRRRRR